MAMARPRLLPVFVVVAIAAAAALLALRRPVLAAPPPAFLGAAADAEAPAKWWKKFASKAPEDPVPPPVPGGRRGGPLDYLHHEVILRSRKDYPVELMFGFHCYGNVILRKACGDRPYPNWLFGFPLGLIFYTYPSAVVSDLLFVTDPPRAMSNNYILLSFSFWFLTIQNSEKAYKFLLSPQVFIYLTAWWLADATRASMLFLERAVSQNPVFSRGVWQAFIWCSAGPILRQGEACLRGAPLTKLEVLQPNSVNPFKYPLVSMFMIMILYEIYIGFFTDCEVFGAAPKRTMIECGDEHADVYACLVYFACLLHIARGYWGLWTGNMISGEFFCMGSCVKAN